METMYFLGIDISKKTFQASLTVNGVDMLETEIENAPKAIKVYFQELKKKFNLTQLTVCMEHTGLYCLPLLDYLTKNKVKVCVEPALQIKQSQGMTRGKSDKVDSKRIAQYAYKNQKTLRFWKPQRMVIQELKALLVLRERLVKMKTQLEVPLNESKEYISKDVCNIIFKNCKSTIATIFNDISGIEKTIEQLIESDIKLQHQFKLVKSVPGIGKITALNMIIYSGEFEQIIDAKKFACYAGVVPFEHTSGSSVRGKSRVSTLANMTLKKLLHMAAMSGIQHSEELNSFYHRKLEQGKNKMSVINAVRNKLISRVFACIKNDRLYEKDFRNALV